LSHVFNHLGSGYFGNSVFPRLVWTTVLLYWASHHSWDDRLHDPAQIFSAMMWSYKLVLPGLAWNHNPPNLSLLHSLG
jgi:hypothetical protein